MFVLDTNVVSELRKPSRANARVAQWASHISLDQLYLSALTVMEIELGVLRMERKDKRQGAELRTWLEGQVLADFSGRILPLEVAVVRDTLNVLLKFEADIEAAGKQLAGMTHKAQREAGIA